MEFRCLKKMRAAFESKHDESEPLLILLLNVAKIRDFRDFENHGFSIYRRGKIDLVEREQRSRKHLRENFAEHKLFVPKGRIEISRSYIP